MAGKKKDATYQFRLSPDMKEFLKKIANALDTTIPDILTTGALMVFQKATNPAAYYRLKAEYFACDTKTNTDPNAPKHREN